MSVIQSYEQNLRDKAKSWLDQWKKTDAAHNDWARAQAVYNTEKAKLDRLEIGGVGPNIRRRTFLVDGDLVVVNWTFDREREREDISVEKIT